MAVSNHAEFLADDRVVRAVRRQTLASVILDRAIGLRDWGDVRLRIDLQVVGAEPLHRDAVGDIGNLEREREVVCHRGSA